MARFHTSGSVRTGVRALIIVKARSLRHRARGADALDGGNLCHDTPLVCLEVGRHESDCNLNKQQAEGHRVTECG